MTENNSFEAHQANERAGAGLPGQAADPAGATRAEIAGLRRDLFELSQRNERLAATLQTARQELIRLKDDTERMSAPPNSFATVLGVVDTPDGRFVDIVHAGRKLRVAYAPDVPVDDLKVGHEVMLNESLVIVGVSAFERTGELMSVKEILDDDRALVVGHADDERVVVLAGPLRGTNLRIGDALTCDTRTGLAYEKIPRAEVQNLVLEEVPDIQYSDIGGLSSQIEQIKDAVELPFLHPELYREHGLKPPKGILLYGPPGCGKTLIAKAVANALAQRVAERDGGDGSAASKESASKESKSYFLNIKGPELLDKYVGETERHIRLIFARAREKASEGTPVVVFFDEMDSLFRTRGTGISSDVETTIVPQLLSEIDGVERLDNVIVIGASNREDMIDPAILRPGRLDVKIKIERPDAEAAIDIFAKYLTADLPLHPDDLAAHGQNPEATVGNMIQRTVERMYATDESNEFLEVTYANGDKEVLFFKDFSSGAMIQNVVDRAKKSAIKEFLTTGQRGLRIEHLLAACVDEFREHEDLPNTTNPDDWAKISGKKGERIVYIRTIIQSKEGAKPGKAIDNVTNTGQYL